VSPPQPQPPACPHPTSPQAILLVRAIALACPPPALEACLRGAYRAFAQNAKFVSAASAAHIHFMGAAVIEMTRLDAGWGSLGRRVWATLGAGVGSPGFRVQGLGGPGRRRVRLAGEEG
jgi:hypothetical protein